MHLYGTNKRHEGCAYGCCGDYAVSKAYRDNQDRKARPQAIATKRSYKRKARQASNKLCKDLE